LKIEIKSWNQADYSQGAPVILCAHNRVLEARHLKVFSSSNFPTDLSFINKAPEGCINQGDELQISYPFDKKIGKNAKMHFRFETTGGDKIKQSFLVTHGHLKRRDFDYLWPSSELGPIL
jgi:hypothetical protein